jgi:hypothetical protein
MLPATRVSTSRDGNAGNRRWRSSKRAIQPSSGRWSSCSRAKVRTPSAQASRAPVASPASRHRSSALSKSVRLPGGSSAGGRGRASRATRLVPARRLPGSRRPTRRPGRAALASPAQWRAFPRDSPGHQGGGDTRQEGGAKEHIAPVGIQPVEDLRREVVRDRVRRAAPAPDRSVSASAMAPVTRGRNAVRSRRSRMSGSIFSRTSAAK